MFFEPDHRKEAVTASLVLTLLLTGSVPIARLTAPTESITEPAQAFAGTGVWVDWTELDGDDPAFTTDDLDRAADQGISTLYIQIARQTGGDPVYRRDRVTGLIDHARGRNMSVIGWYLPLLDGGGRDDDVAKAAQGLQLDGYALDVEHRSGSATARNAELAALTKRHRELFGTKYPLGAIVLPTVLFTEVNPDWWGGPYPYEQMATDFDTLLVMSYATDRKAPWSDSYVHVSADVTYLRALDADVDLHIIGGYGPRFTVDEAEKTARAAKEWCANGVSIYAGADVTGEGWKRVVDNFARTELPCRPTTCVDRGVETISAGAFSPGNYALLPAADSELARILGLINATDADVVVHGHTDSSGESSDNLELSKKRASAVMDWFVTRGVTSSRITVKPWGEQCPIRSNSTAEGRQSNRRVDVEIAKAG